MKKSLSTLFIFLLFGSSTLIFAQQTQQRSMYERLLQRTDQPASYIDHIAIPTSDTTAQVGVFFRLDYDLIPFLRKRPNMSSPSPDDEFFSSLRVGIEVFDGALPESRRSSRGPATSVFRDSWRDTVWVSNFQQTQSRFDHVQGLLQTELNTRSYHYELQLNVGESIRERPSNRRNLTIPNFNTVETALFILAQSVIKDGETVTATLLNYGNNVLYGQDFELITLLPKKVHENDGDLKLSFYKFRPASNTETEREPSYSTTINKSDLFNASFHSMTRSDSELQLKLRQSSDGFTYVHLSIPNSEFQNARYRMELTQEGVDEPIARKAVNSQWIDMPVSLYNIDVAIDMMKHIVSENELRRLRSGSSSEKERKFREFWAERNPTPETEFNELMTEYYRRVDIAYRNYSSAQVPGYDTDQGRTFILFGPPDEIERRLPTNSPTLEIWEYPNRTFIFEATSGFGDFKLISEL